MAMAMPPRVIVLIEAPIDLSTIIVVKSDMGMATSVMRLARRLPRNNSTMIITRMLPSRKAPSTLRTAVSMKLAWRKMFRWMVIPAGKRRLDFVERLVEPLAEFQRVDVRLLGDAQQDRRLAHCRAGAAFQGRADLHHAKLADADRHFFANGDHGVGDLLQLLDPSQTLDEELLAAVHHDAGRGVLVGLLQRLRHFGGADVVGLQLRGREHHLVLLHVAADRRDLGHAFDAQQPSPNGRVGQRPQIEERVFVAADGQEQDFAHRGSLRGHDRLLDFRREAAAHQAELLGHDLPVGQDVGSPVELDPHDREAYGRRGSHAAHAGGPVHRRFNGKRDQRFDLRGSHAVGFREDRHRRRGEVREDIHRHGRRDIQPHRHQGQREQARSGHGCSAIDE